MRISALLCITLCVSLYASEYKSRIVATQLRDIMRDKDSFHIETEQGKFKIPKHHVSKNVRDTDNGIILKLLENESHYLSLNPCSDDEYELRLEQRLNGGGPVMGAAAYWAVKCGCYGLVAAGIWKAIRASQVDSAFMDEARRLMGELSQRATEEAAASSSFVGSAASGAAGAAGGAAAYGNMQPGQTDHGYDYQWQGPSEGAPYTSFTAEANRFIDTPIVQQILQDVRETDPRLADFVEGAIQSGFNTGVGSMVFPGMGGMPVAFSMGQAGLENMIGNDQVLGNMAEQAGRTFIPLANSAANIGANAASSSSSTVSQAAKAGLAVGAATGVAQTAVSQGMEKGGSRFVNTVWKYKEGIKSVFKGIGSSVAGAFVTGNASIEALAVGACALFTAMPGP